MCKQRQDQKQCHALIAESEAKAKICLPDI